VLALAQALHPSPHWPSDNEFLSVNRVIQAACQRYSNVDEQLVWALIWQESKYDPLALGLKGEVGLGQLMPGTASVLGVRDRTNATESVEATVGHLASLRKKCWQLTTEASQWLTIVGAFQQHREHTLTKSNKTDSLRNELSNTCEII
jgi:membrane-bound lytic murein transglycosylase MltF